MIKRRKKSNPDKSFEDACAENNIELENSHLILKAEHKKMHVKPFIITKEEREAIIQMKSNKILKDKEKVEEKIEKQIKLK